MFSGCKDITFQAGREMKKRLYIFCCSGNSIYSNPDILYIMYSRKIVDGDA